MNREPATKASNALQFGWKSCAGEASRKQQEVVRLTIWHYCHTISCVSTFARRFLCIIGLPLCTLAGGVQPSDHLKIRSVTQVRLSPDGRRVAYTVARNDAGRQSLSQLWIMTLADRNTICLSSADQSSSTPEWAPTGVWIAYRGKAGENTGLFIAHPDGSSKRFLAAMDSTNSPLPMPGKAIAWSPDGRQIAYVSSQPGPETADATGDPMVLTRYLYRPTLTEGYTRFNDNKRLHIFIVDVGTGQTRQLSTGNHYEHSIDWSPDGRQIAFVSNREPDEDHFFNYDLFTVDVNTGEIRRLTATESAEYRPRWSRRTWRSPM